MKPRPVPAEAAAPQTESPAQPQAAATQARPRPQPVPAGTGQRGAPVPVDTRSANSVPVVRGGEKDGEEEETVEVIKKSAPAYLVSGVIHMIVIIVLALWIVMPKADDQVTLETHFAEYEGDKLNDDALDFKVPDPVDTAVLTPQHLQPVENPFAAPPTMDLFSEQSVASSDIAAPIVGMALSGREAGTKAALLSRYGGDESTEAAVRMALEWLAKQQYPDGSWSLVGPYNSYRDGPPPENKESATAMALLAFLGAGHTHKQGMYQETVEKGVKWLLKQQLESGRFHTDKHSHHFYTHGQCTIVICELYAMTKDSWLRVPCEKAIQYIVENQAPQGGWRYHPRDELSDTSVTGWIVMALQSAKFGDLEVPQEVIDKVSGYLDRATVDGGSLYGYLPDSGEATPSMTAEALLCRQYLGWDRNDPRLLKGVRLLLKDFMPQWGKRDVYYWYYATQVMHHMEGDEWNQWNNAIKKILVTNQVKSGKERGSWNPEGDEWGPYAGRLYVTCLSTYMLEVYYRHLPIYASLPKDE